MPVRHQIQRRKDWKWPHGAKAVHRGTGFGNPFVVDGRLARLNLSGAAPADENSKVAETNPGDAEERIIANILADNIAAATEEALQRNMNYKSSPGMIEFAGRTFVYMGGSGWSEASTVHIGDVDHPIGPEYTLHPASEDDGA